MLRTILVGLDGSDDCLSAVELGIAWAKRFDILLIAIGVVDEPAIRGAPSERGVSRSYQAAYSQILQETRHCVEQTLSKFALRCAEEQVSHKLLEFDGQPCERISRELQRYDLLLSGTKTHFTLGSERRPCKTLEKLLREAPRPIVVVPRIPKPGSRKPGSQKPVAAGPILLAYDGSTPSARALSAFLGSGLHAISPVQVISIHATSRVEAACVADRAVECLRFHDIDAEPKPIVSRQPPGKLLVQIAKDENASFMVMGAHGQPRLTEWFLGSTTCDALQGTSIPLFLFH